MFSWDKEKQELETYFKNHIAKKHVYGYKKIKIEVIRWKKPDTIIGIIVYVMMGYTLFVTGDHYDAVYGGWSGPQINLEWISRLNLDYFAGKCLASPNGRGFKGWDAEKAESAVKDHLKEYSHSKTFEDVKRDYIDFSSKDGWNFWLGSFGADYFGDSWFEMGLIGEITDYQCHAHLVGLKMAVQQLELSAVVP